MTVVGVVVAMAVEDVADCCGVVVGVAEDQDEGCTGGRAVS